MDSKATDRITLIKDASRLDDAVQTALKRGGPRRIVILNEGDGDIHIIRLRNIDIPLEIAGIGCRIGGLDIAGCRGIELEGFDIVPGKESVSTVSECRDFKLLRGTLRGRIEFSHVNCAIIEGATMMMRNGEEVLHSHECPDIKLSGCYFVNPEPREGNCWCHVWRSAIHVEGCISHGRKPRYGVMAEDNSTISGDHSAEGWIYASYYSCDSLPADVRDTRS